MENINGTDVVGVVSRAVALALAVVTTAATSVGTAVLLTAGADGGSRQLFAVATAAVRATFGV
jgi:hypothetical protein